MEVLLLLSLCVLINPSLSNKHDIIDQTVSSSLVSWKFCRRMCSRKRTELGQAFTSTSTKKKFAASCREKCFRQTTNSRQTLHRSRRNVEVSIYPPAVVNGVTECNRRMAGNSNSTVRFKKPAGNVTVQFRNDTAFVSWAPVKDILSNESRTGYAIMWNTFDNKTRPLRTFCKFYSKNQTRGTIQNGEGWYSSYDLSLMVVMFPKDPTYFPVYDYFQFPRVFPSKPSATEAPSKVNLLPIVVGGTIGGVALVVVVGILIWYIRSRDQELYPQIDPEVDVFITYSRKNEEFVMEELQPLLDDNGIRYKIDYIDFKVGVPWMDNLVDCISKSKRVLIVMSSDYLASMNCRKELREALNVNKLSSLIVLRVDSVSKEDFPKPIRD